MDRNRDIIRFTVGRCGLEIAFLYYTLYNYLVIADIL